MDDVAPFLMNPNYARYEIGAVDLQWDAVYDARFWRMGHLAVGAILLLAFTLPFVAALSIVVSTLEDLTERGMHVPFFALLIIMGGLLLSGYYALFHALRRRNAARRRFRALQETHQLVQGKLVDCSGSTEAGLGIQSGFYVYTDYRFYSPTGKTLTGQQKKRRDDLHKQALPTPGTPVRVLYADDDAYVML